MTDQANHGAVTLSPDVIDTIIAIAVNEVEGVASVGSHAGGGLRHMLSSRPLSNGIDTQTDDAGMLHITLHLEVYYGYVLPELAAKVRAGVADALLTQAGVEVASVDIFVDGIQFDQQ